ncbi:DUF2585 family protein [Hansschlegelia beijingensis]
MRPEAVPTLPSVERACLIFSVLCIAVLACGLAVMGRPLICPCGTIELWHANANDAGTSQHLADWYSPSHVIHGFLLYALGWLLFGRGRRPPLGRMLLLAVAVESAWELIENSPPVIEHYRTATASDAYAGDSVLNSVADVACMIAGFFIARFAPVWATTTAAVAMELAALYVIRDNLTLNVLMILYPSDAISAWQSAR